MTPEQFQTRGELILAAHSNFAAIWEETLLQKLWEVTAQMEKNQDKRASFDLRFPNIRHADMVAIQRIFSGIATKVAPFHVSPTGGPLAAARNAYAGASIRIDVSLRNAKRYEEVACI